MTDAEFVRELAQPLGGESNDYDALLELIGNARIVLLGEASHGTHEFYFERAQITKRLIAEKNFTVLAIEADWPDASHVHRYVRGSSNDANASEALAEFLSRDGAVAAEELFFAEQNARLVKNAEQYYRSMFRGRASSWNLRDRHMVETIEALVRHLNGSRQPKAIVWAHNSHLGDARATEMGQHGELNVGQLIRERFGNEAVLIGFSTHHGSVTAASDWGAIAERKNVRPALAGSYEELFHEIGFDRFWLDLRGVIGMPDALYGPRLERAMGVIYRPESDRLSHYFHSRLPKQFDAIIHIDETRAVEPLEQTSIWDKGELPETYPFKV